MMMGMIMIVMLMRVRIDLEPRPLQHRVAMLDQAARHAGRRPRRRDRDRFVLGKRMQQGRDEHVARRAAQCVEVDVLHQ